MGKPIAGQNQFPYTIGGFLVDGAKINGVTYSKELYIHKQRSYDIYDLMDTDGNIFRFIRIVGNDMAGKRLNYFTVAEELVEQIPNNTFFLKIQDPSRDIYSFVRIYQWHKCITVDGDYVYRTPDIDPRLSGVLINPIKSTLAKNNTLTYTAVFYPRDYSDVDGDWYVNDVDGDNTDNITIMSTDKNTAVVRGDINGYAVLSFVPKRNNSLVSHASINVIEASAEVEFFEVINPAGYQTFKYGDNYTLQVLTYPYDAAISAPLNVEINDDPQTDVETKLVSVSPDNKTYTFTSTQLSAQSSEYCNPEFTFTMTSPIEYSVLFYDLYAATAEVQAQEYDRPGKMYGIPYSSLPKTTQQLFGEIYGPNDTMYPITSSDPEIATIDYQTGILTTYDKLGSANFTTYYEDLLTGLQSEEVVDLGQIRVHNNVYERVDTVPANIAAMAPGTTQNFQFLGYKTGQLEPDVIECRPVANNGIVTVTSSGATVVPSAKENERFTVMPLNITPDYQVMANYNSVGAYVIVRNDPEEIVPLQYIECGGFNNANAMMVKLEDFYDKFNTPMVFIWPRPYYSPQYLLEPISYDETVIELVDPDAAFGSQAYMHAGSVILRIKGLKRGSTEVVIGSKSFPEIQTSFKVIVY